MLDCDWFSARQFATQLERDHVSVQFQLLYLDSCNRTPKLRARQSVAVKWILVNVSPLITKLIKCILHVLSKKKFSPFVIDTINW